MGESVAATATLHLIQEELLGHKAARGRVRASWRRSCESFDVVKTLVDISIAILLLS